MKNKILSVGSALLLAGMLNSCANQENQSQAAAEASVSSETAKTADQTELEPVQAASRKMMKEADMRLRVNDVQSSTVSLERTATRMGGVVMSSQLSNSINETKMLPYNTDSLKQANVYTTTSNLQVRIPTIYLDSFLTIVAEKAGFVDARNINQEDATLQYLSNTLNNQADGGLAPSGSNKELKSATEQLDTENKIDRHIQNLAINDKVKYTTISLAIYQPEKIDYLIVANVSRQMQAGFWSQLLNGVNAGWQLLKMLFVGMVHIWPLWLIGALVYYLLWRRKKSRASSLSTTKATQ